MFIVQDSLAFKFKIIDFSIIFITFTIMSLCQTIIKPI